MLFEQIDFSPISGNAPTAAQTSNALSSASDGIERLLGLGLGAYTAVNAAKNARQQADVDLAASNRTAPLPPANNGFGLSPLMIVGGVALVGVLFFAFRK